MLQKLLFHDEHIEVVAVRLGHIQIIRGQILGAFARNDGSGRFQIPLMVGVDVLGVVCLDEIVAFFGQHHVGGRQDRAQFLVTDDAAFLGGEAAFAATGKITAVMHNADIVGINVVRGPVQAGQLTEICVALRDIFAGIIADIADGRMDGMAHLYRQIHRIIRHPVRFMRCYDNGGLQYSLPALKYFPILFHIMGLLNL